MFSRDHLSRTADRERALTQEGLSWQLDTEFAEAGNAGGGVDRALERRKLRRILVREVGLVSPPAITLTLARQRYYC